MDLASITLAALLVVVVASCATRVNPGVIAVVLAWLIASYVAPRYGVLLGDKAVAAGFPAELFLTLLAVSYLFAQAEANGTLARTARSVQRMAGGSGAALPLVFFALALMLGSCGPGNIAVAGLVAPIAMAAAERTGVSPLVMAVMVGHGAIATSVSPFTASGVVANQKLAEIGIAGVAWQLFAWNVAANTLAALVGYLVLRGWRLRTVGATSQVEEPCYAAQDAATREHAITLVVVALVIAAVLAARVHIGLAAFGGAAVLAFLRVGDERAALAKIPWSVIVMVCGVSVLTSLLDKTGGNQKLAGLIGSVSTPGTLTGVVALVTGVVSIYSSTTGVVLPAFLPLVKDIAAAEPGSSPLSLALSVLVGGNLVDMSPLSTIGAFAWQRRR